MAARESRCASAGGAVAARLPRVFMEPLTGFVIRPARLVVPDILRPLKPGSAGAEWPCRSGLSDRRIVRRPRAGAMAVRAHGPLRGLSSAASLLLPGPALDRALAESVRIGPAFAAGEPGAGFGTIAVAAHATTPCRFSCAAMPFALFFRVMMLAQMFSGPRGRRTGLPAGGPVCHFLPATLA